MIKDSKILQLVTKWSEAEKPHKKAGEWGSLYDYVGGVYYRWFIVEEPQLVISEADCSGNIDQEDVNKNRGDEEITPSSKQFDESVSPKDTPTLINTRDANNNIIEETDNSLNDNFLRMGDTPLEEAGDSGCHGDQSTYLNGNKCICIYDIN